MMLVFRSRIFFVLLLICSRLFLFSQQNPSTETDSLGLLIKKAKSREEKNTLQIKQLNMALHNGDSSLFFSLKEKLINEARKTANTSLLVRTLQTTGIYYYYGRNFPLSLTYLDSAIKTAKKNNHEESLMACLMTRGALYYTRQNYYNALVDYLASEKLMLKNKSEKIGGLYSNIGMVYNEIGDLDQSEIYLKKAIPFSRAAGDFEGIAKTYNNLGLVQKNRQNFQAADSFFSLGLEVARKYDFERDISDILYNRSEVLYRLGRKKEAIESRHEMYELILKNGDPNWRKMMALNLAENYYSLNDKISARKWLMEAEGGDWDENVTISQQADYYTLLAEIQLQFKEYRLSAEAFRKALLAKDAKHEKNALFDVEQIKYNYEKQQDSIAFAKQKEIDDLYNQKLQQESEHKLSRQRIITLITVVILLVIGVFSVFLFRAKRMKEIANNELKEQKRLVSEKNTEITDSINYSRRIQQSLLPTPRKLNHFLPSHFLIYEPKDIVSGDFYWLYHLNDNEFFVAVADCTGHGVPGAIMSALSVQQLNGIARTVREPGMILKRLNKKLKENLQQNEEGFSKDGLDICLCKINISEKKLYYSGANRNLWIFDNNGLKREIKATKTGIGGHTGNEQTYEQHEINVEHNDLFVLSSDGYADQFGGSRMKKITTRQFKLWIAETAELSFEKKEKELKQKFYAWKNNYDQIDDVCVLGFKFV